MGLTLSGNHFSKKDIRVAAAGQRAAFPDFEQASLHVVERVVHLGHQGDLWNMRTIPGLDYGQQANRRFSDC